jgi:hypothetical protein
MSSYQDAVKSGMTEYLDELKGKLKGLVDSELRWQASLESNTIIWLVWHMARVEDIWINQVVSEGETVWDSQGWAGKTGVHLDGNGFGHTPDDVRAFPDCDVNTLVEYFDAVREGSFSVIDGLSDEDIASERVRRDSPITIGWILGHVLVEESQHVGHVGFIRGMIRGLNG